MMVDYFKQLLGQSLRVTSWPLEWFSQGNILQPEQRLLLPLTFTEIKEISVCRIINLLGLMVLVVGSLKNLGMLLVA